MVETVHNTVISSMELPFVTPILYHNVGSLTLYRLQDCMAKFVLHGIDLKGVSQTKISACTNDIGMVKKALTYKQMMGTKACYPICS